LLAALGCAAAAPSKVTVIFPQGFHGDYKIVASQEAEALSDQSDGLIIRIPDSGTANLHLSDFDEVLAAHKIKFESADGMEIPLIGDGGSKPTGPWVSIRREHAAAGRSVERGFVANNQWYEGTLHP
jgi:hypothetical protein